MYAAQHVPEGARPPWFREWVIAWKTLYDDFERLRAADPMMVYQPRNFAVEDFHRSLAFIRYFRAGNRTGKTQAGYAEHYFCVTGSHWFRPMPPVPASTILICGMSFADYATRVFEKKFLYGEDGQELGKNPLSPMFPEGGKWFYRYSAKDHTITICCPDCAAAGRAMKCGGHHKKTTISLVSIEKRTAALEGFTARLAHIDEHVPVKYFRAVQVRLADTAGASVIVTGTPLGGPDSWEVTDLAKVAEGPPEANKRDPQNPESDPLVSIHQCSMREGNIATEEMIKGFEQSWDEFECRVRIDGFPSAIATNPVFNRARIKEMEDLYVREPLRGNLDCSQSLHEFNPENGDLQYLEYVERPEGQLRVWEKPKEGASYICAVDTAAGLHKRDPSCATILQLGFESNKATFRMVAQWHGWIPVTEYADEVFKLACWYNSALTVVELTGIGRAVMERLKKELFYWNLFREPTHAEYANPYQGARMGIDTSMYNKAAMVAILQQVIQDRRIAIPCTETMTELNAFEQERTELGNARFRGAGGSHDDRVMSLVIGVSTAVSYGITLYMTELENYEKSLLMGYER